MLKNDFGSTVLYIDVTNMCNIGCSHCMYKHLHGNDKLTLNKKNGAVLEKLINESEQLCISGVGEPLYAPDVIKQISLLDFQNKSVELITSGSIRWNIFETLLDEIQTRMLERKSYFNLRISLDHWHYNSVKKKNYSRIIKYFIENDLDYMTLSFRSIIQDKNNIHKILRDIFYNTDFKWEYYEIDKLNSILYVNKHTISILFKPQVNHHDKIPTKQPLYAFIEQYEMTYQRDFKLGNIGNGSDKQGINITVKPNGTIELYGLEGLVGWNINDVTLTLDTIQQNILINPILSIFFSHPFKHIIDFLGRNTQMHKIITNQSSPYWVIKKLNELYPNKLKSSLELLVHCTS